MQRFIPEKSAVSIIQPTLIHRAEHGISRNNISHNAIKVLYRLHNAGFRAYLVGGCVRDILLGKHPKDFDVATNAHPEEIQKLFRNCRLIGKRFRLAHIVFGREVIEVATFRAHHKEGQEKDGHSSQHGMIIRDNVYGSIEDDAWRRDFTVNALYYNIADFSILDYTHGMQDLKNGVLRIIGNPEQRYHEDPVRLLRAIRFAGKSNLTLSPETEEPISQLSYLLSHVSPARLFQEVLKIYQEGATLATFNLLRQYKLFSYLFPAANRCLTNPCAEKLIHIALNNTDQRTKQNKPISPTFLFAVFIWHPILEQLAGLEEDKLPPYVAYEKATRAILKEQVETLTIPKHSLFAIQEICLMQYRFTCRYGTLPFRLLEHPRFRAAYDLLLLRAEAGEPIQELSQWWSAFYIADAATRANLIKQLGQTRPRKRKRYFRKKMPAQKS